MDTAILNSKKKRQTINGRVVNTRKSLAGVPKLTRRKLAEQVGVFKNPLPRAKNLVECLGVDLILYVRKFVGHGLYDLMPLMLSSKEFYNFLREAKVVNRAIAKDIFGFSYLCDFYKNIYSFSDILSFRDNISGDQLHYKETSSAQILGNGRLRSKEPYLYWMKMVVYEYGPKEGSSNVLKCVGRRHEVLRLKSLFSEFEETHSAIQMRMYRPYSTCYPIETSSNAVMIHVEDEDLEEVCQSLRQGQKIKVAVKLSLQISVVYYRFVLVMDQIQPCS